MRQGCWCIKSSQLLILPTLYMIRGCFAAIAGSPNAIPPAASPPVSSLQCHKAKNLLPSNGSQPTQTAKAVVEIQVHISSRLAACI